MSKEMYRLNLNTFNWEIVNYKLNSVNVVQRASSVVRNNDGKNDISLFDFLLLLSNKNSFHFLWSKCSHFPSCGLSSNGKIRSY